MQIFHIRDYIHKNLQSIALSLNYPDKENIT